MGDILQHCERLLARMDAMEHHISALAAQHLPLERTIDIQVNATRMAWEFLQRRGVQVDVAFSDEFDHRQETDELLKRAIKPTNDSSSPSLVRSKMTEGSHEPLDIGPEGTADATFRIHTDESEEILGPHTTDDDVNFISADQLVAFDSEPLAPEPLLVEDLGADLVQFEDLSDELEKPEEMMEETTVPIELDAETASLVQFEEEPPIIAVAEYEEPEEEYEEISAFSADLSEPDPSAFDDEVPTRLGSLEDIESQLRGEGPSAGSSLHELEDLLSDGNIHALIDTSTTDSAQSTGEHPFEMDTLPPGSIIALPAEDEEHDTDVPKTGPTIAPYTSSVKTSTETRVKTEKTSVKTARTSTKTEKPAEPPSKSGARVKLKTIKMAANSSPKASVRIQKPNEEHPDEQLLELGDATDYAGQDAHAQQSASAQHLPQEEITADTAGIASPKGEELSKENREAANQALTAGKLQDAVSYFSDAIDANAKDYDAYLGRGRVHLDLGDYGRAMSDFTMADDVRPDYPATIIAIGDLYFARKDYSRAIEYFNTALAEQPENPMATCRRGISHYYRRNFKKALADLESAAKLDSTIPNIAAFVKMAKKKAVQKNTPGK